MWRFRKITIKTLVCVLFAFLYFDSAFSGEIYIWTDKKGVENITTTPPPPGAKIKNKSSFERDTPGAIDAFQRRQKTINDAGFSGWQNSQKSTVLTPVDYRQENSKKLTDRTDELGKKYWSEVDRCRKGHCTVSKSLSEDYHKAIESDPRTIKSTITIRTSK